MSYDAIVIGSGPNGLAAAITLARAGQSVLLREAAPTVGGGLRSAELTLPGFTHDICSTVHAMAGISPFFRNLLQPADTASPLPQRPRNLLRGVASTARTPSHGASSVGVPGTLAAVRVEFVKPPIAFAHPLDDGSAAAVYQSLDATVDSLGRDGPPYRALIEPLLNRADELFSDILGPPRWPHHPLLLARFGHRAIRSAQSLAMARFVGEPARALFAGAAAHCMLPLDWSATAAFGLVLTLAAHVTGWPVVRGGSQRLADALADYFRALGGTIETSAPVESLDSLPPSRAILCDVTPRQFLSIGANQIPGGFRRRLAKFRYGPGVFKMDWALSAPIPWSAAACRQAGTVHLGGTLAEIAAAEAAPWRGEHAGRPYVLLVQPTLMDPTRAPPGKHIAWGYCHVPNGSTIDMTERIESQIERFAPGFRDCILARHTFRTDELERHNPNLIGGDINGGAANLAQLFTRPIAQWNPYATPLKNVYLCSSSTPPGGGVHGMCGYFAAMSSL